MEDQTPERSSLRLKMGQSEVEFHGSETFMKEGLRDLLSELVDVHRNAGLLTETLVDKTELGELPDVSSAGNALDDHTVTSLAKKLDCKKGPDLVKVSIAYLAFVGKKSSFSYNEIFQTMKQGGNYYKESYGNNLKRSLARFVRIDFLRTQGTDFRLSPEGYKEIEARLAQ